MFIQLFFLILLIMLNAFFAASEIALISVNENRVNMLAKQGSKKAVLLKKLLESPSKFLSTIQIGITLVSFFASAFASESFADHLVVFIKDLGVDIPDSILKATSVTIIIVLLSYFTLVFGELVPKRLAMQSPEKISMFSVRPLSFLSKIAAPFVKLLTISTNFFSKLFGGNSNVDANTVTEDEIRMMIDEGQEKGTIGMEEKEMINNIFEFDDKIASEIMTHRTEVISVPINYSLDEIINSLGTIRYTRIPVYENTIDNIVGILHVKDIIKNFNNDNFVLKDIIRRPYFVPESKTIDKLFNYMQKHKIHLAVVIDEYGGTAGIVTIEDLLEEIVGSIFDEHDIEEMEFEIIDENTYMFNGDVNLNKVQKIIGAKLPTGEYDTLSGYIISQLGRIPDENEKPEVETDKVIFKAEEIKEKTISRVKVCRTR